MIVGKMGWLPGHQSVMGAILHYSSNGGIQLGISRAAQHGSNWTIQLLNILAVWIHSNG